MTLAEKLAGRKVLYHGTSDDAAKNILIEGLKSSYSIGKSNNTLHKLRVRPNRPYIDKIQDFNPELYPGLVYTSTTKRSPLLMMKNAEKRGHKGRLLRISVPYDIHRHYVTVLNPEHGKAGPYMDDYDKFSRYLYNKPYNDLSIKEKKFLKGLRKWKDSD